MESQPYPLVNPHLEGGPFFLEGGEVGVMLVHGYTATGAEVRPLAQVLHRAGYTVAGPLLPGHGTTPEELNRTHRQAWHAAVETCYLELSSRCRRVVVGGESLGALLALLLAARHPEVGAVLSYAPAFRFRSRKATLLAPILALFTAQRPKANNPPSASDPRWQGYPVYPLRAAVQVLRVQKEVQAALPRVRQPLLVVQGRLDRTIAVQSAQMVLDRAGSTHKELHWFEQSGHCVLIDCEMDDVSHLTLDFLKRVIGN
jgi:carboxylesterase